MSSSIGLCFSGGGFRASFYVLGVLRYLAEAKHLNDVVAISAVSGGSIATAAAGDKWAKFQAAGGDGPAFLAQIDKPFRDTVTSTNIRRKWMLGSVAAVIPRTGGRGGAYARALAKNLYEHERVADLPRDPDFIFTATDLTKGRALRIAPGFTGSYDYGYVEPTPTAVKLGDAVAASAAFPPSFTVVYLRTGRLPFPKTAPDPLSLVDGGVYDNLGLEWFQGWGADALRPATAKRPDVTIVANASGLLARQGKTFRPLSAFPRDLSIQYEQSLSLRVRWNDERMKASPGSGVYMAIKSDPRTENLPAPLKACLLPSELVSPLALLRTDLDRFSKDEADLLSYHAYWTLHARLSTYKPELAMADPSWTEYANLGAADTERLRKLLELGAHRSFRGLRAKLGRRDMIATTRIDAWLAGLDPGEAGRALLAAGRLALSPPQPYGRFPITPWTLDEPEFARAEALDARALGALLAGRPIHRLAVETDAVPTEILHRLARAPEVESAFIPVDRPAGALRRRHWRWPMRVGLLGFDDEAAAAIFDETRAMSHWVENLLTGWRVEDEPSAVDVLVCLGPLESAVEQLTRMQPIANAVVVLDRPLQRHALLDAQMAVARAATAAVASALTPPRPVAQLLYQLVLSASHAEPFDVALSRAAGSETLLWAEPDGLTSSELRAITRREVNALEVAFAVPSAEVFSDREIMRTAAEGEFSGETHEASQVAAAAERVEPALEALDEPRWSQARLGADNVLRRGANRVGFFIGPLDQGALAAPVPFDESQLPWDEENAVAFRLTVVFIPGVEDPEPQQAELDLPRFGRSRDVSFALDVADTATEASARILVLFRNRLLQTAVLKGQVGQEAELAELASLVPQLAGLDDRRPFDAIVFANHNGGSSQLTRHSNGITRVSGGGGVPEITETLAGILREAAGVRSAKGLGSEAARKLMIKLAVNGHDFHDTLLDKLGPLAEVERIQIVAANNDWLLPLELAYPRPAPEDSAKICDRFLADPKTCKGACTGANDTSRLCPNAFWGLSKTIERHRYDPETDEEDPEEGHLLLSLTQPRPGARTLNVTNALFGASSRVAAKDRAPVVAALRNATDAADWDGWKTTLGGQDTQLLVLLPHVDHKARELEISKKRLARGRIEPPYVTGERDVNPIVVLFGCRTTGTRGDPSGYAVRFMQKGARVAFHSIADLLNVDASKMALALTIKLLEPGRKPQMLSDTLAAFRREAVYDGMIVAFAISAFGDADWRL